jgi:pilus assembly protein Flp/PilA
MELMKRFVREEEGADATEYALVIGLVALAIVAGAKFLGGSLGNGFNLIGTRVTNAVPAS